MNFTWIFTATPDAPTGPLKAVEVQSQSITIQWEPPKHNGGSPLTAYIIEFRNAKRVGWDLADEIGADKTIFKIKKLIKNNDYFFRVFAKNKAGISLPLESKLFTAKDAYGKSYKYVTYISFKVSLKVFNC